MIEENVAAMAQGKLSCSAWIRHTRCAWPVALLLLTGCGGEPGEQEVPNPAEGRADELLQGEGHTLPDFAAVSDMQERKRQFFDFMRPIIVAENASVLVEREGLLKLHGQHCHSQPLLPDDVLWLDALAREYGLAGISVDSESQLQELCMRVDIIPVPLALVQAAHESAWGTSRLARLGNAIFGQWCVQGYGIVPARRDSGATHEVARFATVNQAVRSYIHNLNTNAAYCELRRIRFEQRQAGESPSSFLLVDGLRLYSERREAYVDEIRGMLCTNRLLCLGAASMLLCAGGEVSAENSAVILQYHHVGDDTPPSTSVTLEQFGKHLTYLDEHGYNVWSLERVVSSLQGGKQLPENCVAITIDDAYRSVHDEAFPRLKERGWPFTVFVSTEGVDLGIRSYMTWDQMRELSRSGVVFAPHSHTHGHLVYRQEGESEQEWRNRVTRDIQLSMERLEQELGSVPNLFAYPYGEYNAELKRIVLDLDLVGLGQQSGAIWPGSDFGALPRFAMSVRYAGMEDFVPKVRSLPLPVLSAEPDDPFLQPGISKPVLRLQLAPGDYQEDRLACYASGQGAIEVRWIDREKRIVELVAVNSLPLGRSRYNITAPHTDGGRYYWYSHLWIHTGERF
ncbi:MAG: polysaccharide deacetylase family protein [Candidatus Eisenbacteria sp.]|nr:polysaccharide deacetylase family protein [Candidatus Eisenbacteria bacterium]